MLRLRATLTTVLVTCALCFMSSVTASAQVLYGSIVGNVKDSSGAAVPGANVTVTNRETSQVRTTVTNEDGSYNLPTVQSGTYNVRVTREGFRAMEETNVAVTINSVARVDLTLQVGAVTESVIVSSSAAQLQTDRAEVRTEITAKALTEIPVSGQRNYQALFITVPGITPPSTPHSIPSNPSRSMSFSANGTNMAANNTRIDGASATNIWLPHISSYVPALESIETVNVVTNSFDAEQGLAGGAAVNVQIRSGSNELHGAGFWYHMGNWSQSRPFFLPGNQDIPKFVYNQSGGRLGGPIVKNKLFYFGSYERTTDRRFAFRIVSVPTAAMRRGDLSASPTTIYNPRTGNPDGTGRVPYANNMIPESDIDPTARRLMNLLPLPNTGPANAIAQNFYAGAPFSFDRHTIDSKVNYNINEKWTAFGRLSWLKFNTFNQTVFGNEIGGGGINSASNPGNGYGGTWSGTLGSTYVLSPSVVVDAYYGYTLMDANVEQPGLGTNIGRDDFKIPGTNGTRRFESGMPGFGIDGFESFGSTESFMPYFRRDPQQQWVANVNWTRGSHNIRFGFETYNLSLNHTQPEFTSGGTSSAAGRLNSNRGPTQLSSTNATGGVTTSASSQYNSMGSFLLGLITDGGRLLQVPDEYTTRTGMLSFYLRDQWQVSSKLTLNYGTRYEYFPMPQRSDRGMERYDFATNEMLLCGQGSIPKDCGTKQSKMLFSPRMGLAYRATEKTVFRAGFGLNWDPWNLARPLRTNFPILAVQTIQAPTALGFATTFAQGLPLVPVPDTSKERIPLPPTYAVNTTDDEYRRGYILNWNATIERELPGNFAGQVAYVANRSIAIAGVVDMNAGQILGADRAGQPLFQRFGRAAATNLVDAWSFTNYHGLQSQLKRRFSNGVQMNVSYTWSKAIGFCCNDDNNGRPRVQALSYLDLNRVPLNFDRTHNLQISGTFELPFGKGKPFGEDNAFVRGVLGGWQLNTLLSMMSGTPFSVTSSANSLRMPGNDQRADQVKETVEKLGGVGTGQPFYDRSAFARVTEARFGTAGFNNLRGPGAFSADASLFRRFALSERTNLEFRAEGFNVTNTPRFNNPNSNIDDTNALWITGVNSFGRDVPERILRVGLRLSF